MRLVLAISLVLGVPVAGLCQGRGVKQALATCAAIFDVDDRLSCYDRLALAVAGPAEAPVPGRWQSHVTRDALDDGTSAALSLLGNDLQAQMVVRCQRKKLAVVLSWRGRYLGATEPTVWTRFGAAKAEKRRWSFSTDHKALLLAGDVRSFLARLQSVEQVAVRIDHFSRGQITETFDVRELRDVIGSLRGECKLE